MFKKALLLLSTLALSAPVNAAEMLPSDHASLYQAIQEVGSYTYLNPGPVCGKDGHPAGMYTWNNQQQTALIVCQDNATSETEVAWTENDLDTLRHEAWHIIQDCHSGIRGDAELAPMEYTPAYVRELIQVAEAAMGPGKVEHIIRNYSANGLSHRDVTMEVEAFTAAAILSASDIETALRNACTL